MREYGVTSCSEECGMLVVAPSYDMRYRGVMWTYMENPVGAELRYCPFCGTRVGVERRENGSISWREAMVPRAALEWLARKRMLVGCPGEWDCEAYCREDCGGTDEEEAACWMAAALKATEEGSDDA